jgi:hypothetical protein
MRLATRRAAYRVDAHRMAFADSRVRAAFEEGSGQFRLQSGPRGTSRFAIRVGGDNDQGWLSERTSQPVDIDSVSIDEVTRLVPCPCHIAVNRGLLQPVLDHPQQLVRSVLGRLFARGNDGSDAPQVSVEVPTTSATRRHLRRGPTGSHRPRRDP